MLPLKEAMLQFLAFVLQSVERTSQEPNKQECLNRQSSSVTSPAVTLTRVLCSYNFEPRVFFWFLWRQRSKKIKLTVNFLASSSVKF